MRATVEDYFDMLTLEFRGQPYSKATHRRRLMRLLSGRSETAIERKQMNISAVLRAAGVPFIDGYKPLENFQALLARAVHERLTRSDTLLEAATRITDEVPRGERYWQAADPSLEVLRPEPVVRDGNQGLAQNEFSPVRYDFFEREAANRALGERGERFVLEVERRRLSQVGRDDLVKRVVWVSKDEGDGLGFDIRSFDPFGAELMVEVKTTNHGRRSSFIVTRNEVRVSEQVSDSYRLYRVFHFVRDPHFYILPGALSRSCSSLAPRSYTATP